MITRFDAKFHMKALGTRMFMRVPLGVPDWGTTQRTLVANYILKGRSDSGDERSILDLGNNLRRLVDGEYSVATASGREAIKLALLSMQARPGDRVVLPSFCCLSVLLPILELGLTPVFADVGEDWQIDPESVRKVMKYGDRALIVPHLFGRLADIPALKSIANQCGVMLIDDAAQAIGALAPWGLAGGGGDVGIFSFGLFKPLTAMGGGALITNNLELFERAQALADDAPVERTRRAVILKTYAKLAWRKQTFLPELWLKCWRQKKHQSNRFSVQRNPDFRRISPFDAQLATSQLEHVFQSRERLKESASAFMSALQRISFLKNTPQDYAGSPRWVVELTSEFANSAFYERLFEHLVGHGIEVQPTYVPLHHFVRATGQEPLGEFTRSDALSGRLLCLPFSRHVDIRHISKCLERFSVVTSTRTQLVHAGHARK